MDTIESLQPASCATIPRPPCLIKTGTAKPHRVEAPRSKAIPNTDATPRTRRQWEDGFGCERETIRSAQLGDAVAWERLVQGNVGWILRTCSRWVGSREKAEDVTQEVFIRVFQTLHSFRDERGGFRAWVSRITRNMLIDTYRRESRERNKALSFTQSEGAQGGTCPEPSIRIHPDSGIEKQERIAALRAGLLLLCTELREAVVLRDVEGLHYDEIALLLNTPVGTVKSRVHRGRIELARLVRHRMAFNQGAYRAS